MWGENQPGNNHYPPQGQQPSYPPPGPGQPAYPGQYQGYPQSEQQYASPPSLQPSGGAPLTLQPSGQYNPPPLFASNSGYPPNQEFSPTAASHPYPPSSTQPSTHYSHPQQGGTMDAYASFNQSNNRPPANSFAQQQQQQQPPLLAVPSAGGFDQPSSSDNHAHLMPSYTPPQQQQQSASSPSAPSRRLGFGEVVRPTLPLVKPVTNKMRVEVAEQSAYLLKKRLLETYDVNEWEIIKDEIKGMATREEESNGNFLAGSRPSSHRRVSGDGNAGALLPLIEAEVTRIAAPLTSAASADSIVLPQPSSSSSSTKDNTTPTQQQITTEEAEQIVHAARGEHNNALYSLCSSVNDHGDELGAGIVYYFEFMKFVIGVCLVYTVLQIIQYAIFIKQDAPAFASGATVFNTTRRWFDDFSITGYSETMKPLWLGMNIFAIIVTFASCPLYYALMTWKRKRDGTKIMAAEGKSIKRDRLLRIDDVTGLFDVSYHYRSPSALIVRRVLAVIIIIAFLTGQILSSYFLTQYPKASIGISFTIALLTTLLNGFFRFMASKITEMMKPQTFEVWKKLHTTMLMTIRMGNLITVYAAKDYKSTANVRCTYDLVGEQFITLLFVEIFITNTSTVVTSMLRNHYAAYIAVKTKSKYGDRDNLPNFDIAFNYLNLLYRLYIALMAMVVTPMTICLSLFGFALQFWIEKFLLFKICGRPKKVYSSQKNFLSILLVLIAVASMVTPFAGSIFIMGGITGRISDLCEFP